jgi:hypothetical protein
MTKRCVKKLVDFINVFNMLPRHVRQVVAIFRGVVDALQATRAMSVLWAYTGYDPSSVASCRGMYPSVYRGFSSCGAEQFLLMT